METLEEFQKLERTFAPRIKFVMSKEPCRFDLGLLVTVRIVQI